MTGKKKSGRLIPPFTAGRVTGLVLYVLLAGAVITWAVLSNGADAVQLCILGAIALAGLVLALIRLPKNAVWKAFIALIIPAAAFFLMETMTHIVWETMEADAVFLNLVFYYLLAAALFVLFSHTAAALFVTLVIACVLGLANYFVILFRSSPVLPWDVLSIGIAANVASNYNYTITWTVAQMLLGFLVCFVLCTRSDLRFPKIRPKLAAVLLHAALLAIIAIPSVFYVICLYDPDISEHTSLDNTLFTPKYMFKTNGFVVAFIMDTRYLTISTPEGYSRAEAEDFLNKQGGTELKADVLPNVLVIMDECFSDPAAIAPFSTAEDYMPFVHSLLAGHENTVSGSLYMSVLGGNTANSEFEFLTGDTMAFLPKGSVPYQQYLLDCAVSSVSTYNDLGYRAVAMHPYNASGWNRNKVYALMGFDDLLFSRDFKNRQTLRKYVSDRCDFENVLRIFDETEEPLFVYNVTMQNHSGFANSTDPENTLEPKLKVTLSNTKTNQYLTNYLTLMLRTDTALEWFLSELAGRDEPTIVVFFGDHQPYDHVVKPIYVENGMDIENQSFEEQLDRMIVPFFIWANYDIDEAKDLKISPNYLGAKTMEIAGLPLSPYQSFLLDMSETIPAINALGYLDADGSWHYLNDAGEKERELISRYEKLQYYFLFDQKPE